MSSSTSEEQVLKKLASISSPYSEPVIAIDLDDVLSQTNCIVSEWHNENYGTDMDISKFYYYYYWKNPYWGTPAETHAKVTEFYTHGRINESLPVPGARGGVKALRDMSYRLVIVTARNKELHQDSWNWVDKHFPNMFDSLICTGHFKAAMNETPDNHVVATKLSKAEICADLKAALLIDDSLENAMQCALAPTDPTHVLLFGDYEWNKRLSSFADMRDDMTYEARLKIEGPEFWKKEVATLPTGAVERAKDWAAVVRWIENARQTGLMPK